MSIEEVILKRQIYFNNNWPAEKEVNTEALNLLLKRMDENELNQLIVSVFVKENESLATFTKDKELAKIFSAYLDVFHFLPLHPDLAFDNIWRTLEYTGAPDKPCGEAVLMLTQKHVAKRYMIAKKVVPLHYESEWQYKYV